MTGSSLEARMTHRASKSVVREDDLRTHAATIEARHLLLAAVHVTGDLSLLDRFAPRLPTNDVDLGLLIPDPDLERDPPEVREELLDILCSVLTVEDQPAYLHPDDPELFTRLATVAIGGPVDETELPMCMEQSGFVPDRRVTPPTRTAPESFDVAIIGAGMTGLDAAVKASLRGIDFTVYEMESGIGGVWWSQTYPGVAVDTPSLQYSLSYELTPRWSKHYPVGDEYLRYLHHLAEKYEVANRVECNAKVLRMDWLEDELVWELTILDTVTDATRTVRHSAVLAASGHLCRPKYPQVPGMESFTGEQLHTSRWRDVEVEGKHVAVVGVGAAGVQVIGALAPVVGRMTVFQRQAHWIMPNWLPDEGNVPESELWLRVNLPYYMQWTRFQTVYATNVISIQLVSIDEEWRAEHPESISRMNDFLMRISLKHIHDSFGEGSELARKLTPDFPFASKRPVRDSGDLKPGGYYWAYLQPHVDLVTEGIAEIVPQGIVTTDGALHEVDVIVWATGMTLDFLSTIEIVGRDGIRLSDVWADNTPSSYLGGTVPGFPNLFVIDGPNTGIATGGGGHTFMAEVVDHYTMECLQLLFERGAAAIEVTQEAHDRHNERIEEAMAGLIWAHEHRAHTYYTNQAGRAIFPNPFTANTYWTMSQQPDESAFVLYERSPLEVPVPEPR